MTGGVSGAAAGTGITKVEIAKRLADIKAQTSTDAKGKAFEDLADYLFTSLGCRTKRNITSPLHSEQLDLVGIHVGALAPLPTFFIIECKYWEKRVESKAVGYFINICKDRGTKLAIVFAKNGLTGSKKKQTAAHSVGFGAALAGVHLIVVTEADLASFDSNEDFANMLLDAWMSAAGGSGVGLS